MNSSRITICLIASLAYWHSCLCPNANAATADAPLEVESVVLRLLFEAEVPAQEAGVLTTVAVREGQQVREGELLAQIDDRVARIALTAAELAYEEARIKATNDVDLRYARKALEVAEAELQRSKDSIERFAKSISQSQLDVERLTVDRSRLAQEQAEHEAELNQIEMRRKENEASAARLEVERRQIVAPFDGVVVQIFVRLGEWVEPGERALRIVDSQRLKAEGFIAAGQATAALIGAPVRLVVALADDPAATFDGNVVFVSPEVDPITGQVRVWAEIDNPDGRLRPGQPVRMSILRTRQETAARQANSGN